MNTPQSPFAPLQKLQEERNEGWMTEMITPTAEEKERADFEKSYRKAYPDADADIFSRQEDGHYFNLFVNGMWKLWKDFSASQEVKA